MNFYFVNVIFGLLLRFYRIYKPILRSNTIFQYKISKYFLILDTKCDIIYIRVNLYYYIIQVYDKNLKNSLHFIPSEIKIALVSH